MGRLLAITVHLHSGQVRNTTTSKWKDDNAICEMLMAIKNLQRNCSQESAGLMKQESKANARESCSQSVPEKKNANTVLNPTSLPVWMAPRVPSHVATRTMVLERGANTRPTVDTDTLRLATACEIPRTINTHICQCQISTEYIECRRKSGRHTYMFTVASDTPGVLCRHLEFADSDTVVWRMMNCVDISSSRCVNRSIYTISMATGTNPVNKTDAVVFHLVGLIA